jgi:hypothetical protein
MNNMRRRVNTFTVIARLAALWFTKPAHAQFAAGTVASYAGQSFTTGGVTYTFPTNDYDFTGTNVELIPASAINLRPDPNGANTILISCTNWDLTQPNENVSLNIYFQVTNADVQGGWQHYAAVSGDGSVSESTVVEASPPAVSISFQTATNGVDQPPRVWFADVPQNVVATISLSSGQNGTVSLKSYGTHFGLQFPQLSLALKGQDTVQLNFAAPAGLTLTLESSTNLSALNWPTLATFLNTNSADMPTNYFDAIGSNKPHQFYRLSLP